MARATPAIDPAATYTEEVGCCEGAGERSATPVLVRGNTATALNLLAGGLASYGVRRAGRAQHASMEGQQ